MSSVRRRYHAPRSLAHRLARLITARSGARGGWWCVQPVIKQEVSAVRLTGAMAHAHHAHTETLRTQPFGMSRRASDAQRVWAHASSQAAAELTKPSRAASSRRALPAAADVDNRGQPMADERSPELAVAGQVARIAAARAAPRASPLSTTEVSQCRPLAPPTSLDACRVPVRIRVEWKPPGTAQRAHATRVCQRARMRVVRTISLDDSPSPRPA